MEWIFRSGKENTAARYEYRARISTLTGRKSHPSRQGFGTSFQTAIV
jgi:hypothetical protein